MGYFDGQRNLLKVSLCAYNMYSICRVSSLVRYSLLRSVVQRVLEAFIVRNSFRVSRRKGRALGKIGNPKVDRLSITRERGDCIVATIENDLYTSGWVARGSEITVDFRDCNMSRQISLPDWNVKWEKDRLIAPQENERLEVERGTEVSWKSTWLALPLSRISRGKDKEF